MGNPNTQAGHQLLKVTGHSPDGSDIVVDKEYLAASLKLAVYGLCYNGVIKGADVRLDRIPVLRRGCNDTKIPDPHQRHVQGPGYGRGSQCQDIHQLTHLLELLLVGHSKTLLFVKNDQAEVSKGNILLQKPMSPDDNVDLPFL